MGKEKVLELSITPDMARGSGFWWDSPPDFDLLKRGLEVQRVIDIKVIDIKDEFSWDWNLGKEGMPIVVEIVGDHTRECRFWFGPDDYKDVPLGHNQNFGEVVRGVGIHGKINLRDKNEIKTEIVKFPKVITVEEGGRTIKVELEDVNQCTVLMAR